MQPRQIMKEPLTRAGALSLICGLWPSGSLLLLCGCVLAAAAPPQVEVADVTLTEIGVLDQMFLVTLCVTNPNGGVLEFAHANFDLEVNGAPFATGITEEPVQLPPLTSTFVPLAATTTIRYLDVQSLDTLRSGAIAFRMSGSVRLAGVPFAVLFSRSDHFPLLSAGLQLAGHLEAPTGTKCGSPPVFEANS